MRIYIEGYEYYKEFGGGDITHSLSLDNGNRFVMIENSSVYGLLTRYIHPNHQSSCTLETDDNGDIITYEEYHPFGTTSYQATNSNITAAAKRYRYTGMERDDETGLNYHNARYYIPWLGRWLNPDPIGIGDGVNVYAYCGGNPVMGIDKKGTQTEETLETPPKGSEINPVELDEVVVKPEALTETAKGRIHSDAYLNVLIKHIPDIDISNLLTETLEIKGDPKSIVETITGIDKEQIEREVAEEVDRLTTFALRSEAGSLGEMFLLARYQRENIAFVGDVIEMIKADPAFKDYEQETLESITAGEIELPKRGLTFGGERGSLPGLINPLDTNRQKTLDVVTNPLTWMLRHADIQATPHNENGQLTVDYAISDKLDLTPHKGDTAYNAYARTGGFLWGNVLNNSFPNTRAHFSIKY